MPIDDSSLEIFEVLVREDAGSVILAASGELDVASVPRLREALLAVPESARHVTLDLTALTFIDSTGLHLLVSEAERRGERLLVRSCEALDRLLDITGLSGRLRLAPD